MCLPSVYINRMDHLTSYVQVVTDATQELCDLILSCYREKLSEICRSGECISYNIYFCSFLCSSTFFKTLKSLCFTEIRIRICSLFNDNLGTTSQMPDHSSLPDPETPEDFLKCKSLSFQYACNICYFHLICSFKHPVVSQQ